MLMKTSRFIILGFFLGLALSIASFIPHTFADDDKFAPQKLFFDTEVEIEDIFAAYHGAINTIFNTSIQEMIGLLTEKELDEEQEERLRPPEVGDEDEVCLNEDAGTLNVSTFCVAYRANQLFEVYEGALAFQDAHRFLQITNLQEPVNKNLKEMLQKELQNAQRVLNLALEGYKELRLAFPIHMEFENTKEQLLRYRDHLVEIRKEVDQYPGKFHDATTSECT